MRKFLIVAAVLFVCICTLKAQNKPCPFDEKTLQFTGTPLEQAKCLLRQNFIYGKLGEIPQKLPSPLEKIIGKNVSIDKTKLRNYLKKQSISEENLGGSLDRPLAFATLPDGKKIQAIYFLIHDTSSPYLKEKPFPENFNTDKNWRGNDLSIWLNNPVAHIFVNRFGELLTTTPFEEPVRKGFGTKFARDFLKAEAKGLQIHIELIQPRRFDEKGFQGNDAIAPVPGFTPEQYKRLALLYICASIRRGTWLIPAYHSAIDAGIKDAHDDPQNFELTEFANELNKLLKKMK